MAEIQDTDLILINQDNKTHTVTGKQFIEDLKPDAIVLKPQIITPTDGAGRTLIPESDQIDGWDPVTKEITLVGDKDLALFEIDDLVLQDNAKSISSGQPELENYGSTVDDGVYMDAPATWETSSFFTNNFYGGATVTKKGLTGGIGIGSPDSFDAGIGDFTISYWYRLTNVESGNIYHFNAGGDSGTSNNRIYVLHNVGKLSVSVYSTLLNSANGDVKSDGWYHIAVMRKDGVVALYMNGVKLDEQPSTVTTNMGNSQPVLMGLGTNKTYTMTGGMQDFVYARRALFNTTGFTPPPQAVTDRGAIAEWAKGASFCVPLNDVSVSPRGIVGSVNIADKKITLKETNGDWSANTGNWVIGPVKTLSDTAPDPSGVNFVGSNFVSSDGSLVEGSADWQVTTLADTGYSSIVSSVPKHPDMSPPSWTSGELEGETEYRARTKYYAASGEASEWSDDVTFKTDVGKVSIVNKPGQLYFLTNRSNITKPNQPPVKLVNFTLGKLFYESLAAFGIGADGNVYKATNKNNLSWSQYTFDGKAVGLVASYLDSDKAFIIANNDGTLSTGSNVSAPPASIQGKINNLVAVGCGSNVLSVETNEGEIWVYGTDGNAKKFGSTSLSANSWVNANVSVPPGESIVKIAGIPDDDAPNYSTANLAILTDVGNVYTVIGGNSGPQIPSGPPSGGTNSSPNLWLTDVKDINPIDRSDIKGGFTALKNDNTLWLGTCARYGGYAFNAGMPWQQLPDDDWTTTIYSMPQLNGAAVAVKKDGYIYVAQDNAAQNWQKLDYNGNPEGLIRTFGLLPSCQQDAAFVIPLIIPDA